MLSVDSSTVSRRLAAMEQSVGSVLVLRSGREFSFTAEGKAAICAAESIEAIITAVATSIRAAKTGVDGVVKLSAVPSMVRPLMPLLSIAAEKHPKLSIELNAATRVVDLAKGEADIAIRMIRPTEIDLIAKRAFEMGFGVYASRAYAARHDLPKNYEDLKQHRLILYIEPMLHLPWFQWIETYADTTAPAARVDSTEMALGVIASGAGIGVVSCTSGDGMTDLTRVFPEPVAIATGWIVYHEAARNSARIRAVVEMLSELFEVQKDKLSGRRPPE